MSKNKMTAKGIAQTATIHCKEGKREVEQVIEKAIKEYHQSRLSELEERVFNMGEEIANTGLVRRTDVLNLIEQMQEP